MKKIRLDPYGSYVLLVRNLPEAKRAYRRLAKKNPDIPHNAYGFCQAFERKGSTDVYLVYAKSTSDLAHEFGHVLLNLFKEIRSNPADGNGEPFCYMLSHLMDQAAKA